MNFEMEDRFEKPAEVPEGLCRRIRQATLCQAHFDDVAFTEWNETLGLYFIGNEGIHVVRAFATKDRSGMHRRRPSAIFPL